MLKLCGFYITKRLEIVFQNYLRLGKFPSEWKMANDVPTLNKVANRTQKNIALFLFSKFSVKSLNGYFITTCFHCNWTRSQNHLVLKRTLNHLAKLAKWLSVRLRTKWFWVRVQLQSLYLQISRLLRARSSLTFRQL